MSWLCGQRTILRSPLHQPAVVQAVWTNELVTCHGLFQKKGGQKAQGVEHEVNE